MCQQLTTLAANSDTRQIWRCEHGTIHLNWDWVTVRLRPNDFRRTVRLLEEGVTELSFNKICNGNYKVVQQENGYYQLWFGEVMLLLDVTDYLRLVDLARVAEQQLNKLLGNNRRFRPGTENFKRKFSALSGPGFSVN